MSQACSDLCNEIVNASRRSKRMTLATFKSWMRKHEGRIQINVKSSFDGMTDGLEPCHAGFRPLTKSTFPCNSNLGFDGVWLVRGAGDSFRPYEDKGLIGIEVYNCCGHWIVAIEK